MKRKVVIIGATSGIGRALAEELHRRGCTVALTGRRTGRLQEMQTLLRDRCFVQPMDVTLHGPTDKQFANLIEQMGGMDAVVLNAGVSNLQGSAEWEAEHRVIEINITGFAHLANRAFHYFEQRGEGHMVGISSVAGLFGYGRSAAYNASKAFVSNYLQGYRQKANHSNADITVTDIQPGFVESEMTDGKKGMFWVASKDKAASQIADVIEQKRNHAYITRRWRLVAWLVKCIPDWVWDRI